MCVCVCVCVKRHQVHKIYKSVQYVTLLKLLQTYITNTRWLGNVTTHTQTNKLPEQNKPGLNQIKSTSCDLNILLYEDVQG